MPYEYLEDEAIADIAFMAKSETLEGLFYDAAKATCNLQTNIDQLQENEEREFEIVSKSYERLLKNFLDEIIYLKDADLFFVKDIDVNVSNENNQYIAKGKFTGDIFDPDKYEIGNDLKAITYHDFYLKEMDHGWECYVLIDI